MTYLCNNCGREFNVPAADSSKMCPWCETSDQGCIAVTESLSDNESFDVDDWDPSE